MKKAFKITLLLLLVLAFLVVAVPLLVLTLFDPDEYREQIAEAFRERTGLVMDSIGRIELDYYPWLDLRLEAVVIRGPEGYRGKPLVELQRARVRVRTSSLLLGPLHVDVVQLHGADLYLFRDASGRSNWASGEDAVADRPQRSVPDEVPALLIGGLDLQKVNLQWHDETTGRQLQLGDLELQGDAFELGRPVSLQGKFRLQATPGELRGEGVLQAKLTYQGDDGQVSGDGSLRLQLEDQRVLESKLRFALVPEDGELEVSEFDLRLPGLEAAGALRLGGEVWSGHLMLRSADVLGPLRLAGLQEAAAAASKLPERKLTLQLEQLEAHAGKGPFRIAGLRVELLGGYLQTDLEGSGLFDPEQLAARGQLRLRLPDAPRLAAFLVGLPGLGSVADLGEISKRLSGLSGPRSIELDVDLDLDVDKPSLALPRLQGELLGLRLEGTLSGDESNLSGKLTLVTDHPAALGALAGNPRLGEGLRSMRAEVVLGGSPERLRLDPVTLRLEPKSKSAGPLTVTLRGELQPGKASVKLDSVRAEGWGLAAAGRLEARWKKGASLPQADGSLQVPEFDPGELLRALGLAGSLPGGDGTWRKLALDASFKSDGKRLEVPRLLLLLDQTRVQGRAELVRAEPVRMDFELGLDRIDLDAYLPPGTEPERKPAAQPAGGTGELSEEQLRRLAGVVLKGTLRADEVILRGVRLQDLAAELRGEQGRFRIEPLTAKLYQGQARIVLRADASVPKPRVDLEAELKGVQAKPLLKDVVGKDVLSGVLGMEARLVGAGADAHTILAGSNGEADFAVRDGALYGVNLLHRMRQWKFFSGLLKGRAAPAPEEQKTDFTEFSASAKITDGVLRNEDLLLSSPVLRLAGRGEIDLGRLTADYRLSSALLNPLSEGDKRPAELRGIELPIHVHGPLAKLEYDFDYKQLLTRGVVDAVSDKVRGAIGNLLGKDSPDEAPAEQEQDDGEEQQSVPGRALDELKKLF